MVCIRHERVEGRAADAPTSDAVLPYFKVAGFFKAGLDRDDRGIHKEVRQR